MVYQSLAKGAKGEQERTKSDGDGGVSITRPHVKLRLIPIQKFLEPSVLARLIHVAFIFGGFWETERWLIVRVRIVAGTPSRVQYRTGGERVEKKIPGLSVENQLRGARSLPLLAVAQPRGPLPSTLTI